MSEKLGGNFSLETYIGKQEGLLLDFVRKTLQGETKISLLETALQEMYKKAESLNEQLETYKMTSEQSIAGLQAVTLERDNLKNIINQIESERTNDKKNLELARDSERDGFNKKVTNLEQLLAESKNEAAQLRATVGSSNNRVAVLENEIRQLNNKIEVAGNDYATLKENYNRVLTALNDSEQRVQEFLKAAEESNQKEVIDVVEAIVPSVVKKRAKKQKTQETDSEWVDGEYKIST